MIVTNHDDVLSAIIISLVRLMIVTHDVLSAVVYMMHHECVAVC